jgi:hypothetical protein
MGRKRVLANGSLLEVQPNASHPSFVNLGAAFGSDSRYGPEAERALG